MDEKIVLSADGAAQLSPQEEALLAKYTEAVVVEDGASLPVVPDNEIPVIICKTPPELVANIYNLQPEKRLLVVTRSQVAGELALALRRSFDKNIPSVQADGKWYAAALLAEMQILENLILDEDGNAFILTEEVSSGVFTTEDGRLLVLGANAKELDGKALTRRRDGSDWGTLLSFKRDVLEKDYNFYSRTRAAHDLTKQLRSQPDGVVPAADGLLFMDDNSIFVTRWDKPDDHDAALTDVLFRILFDEDRAACPDVLGLMLDRLAAAENAPACFVSDLEQIYLNGRSCGLTKWGNILFRLMLEYEENPTLYTGKEAAVA